ncbi:dihydrofolate reductase family protein [Kurthia sibirica]|uniref:Dihydrofolate reductase n=1 Tax=Kurthia sibirica TaxID=202750 RepID=A0A2U3AJA4_9BACL|nr:dihydrofolate reductase family protein [Kurthia sibirica]PWI24598.1 dihydrofolate reductase [Kurthia sibirica]GEK33554.1 dihydrofolate reductase [Kurthia sibirica]
MRTVKLFIAMSLDGYIADPSGQIDFLESIEIVEEDKVYDDFIQSIDTVVLGSTTYKQIIDVLSPDDYPYKNMTSYVLSSQADLEAKNNVVIVQEPICDLVARLKNSNGGDIWIVGGASIINPLIEANAIDDYELTIMPYLLGQGIPLFTEKSRQIPLELHSTVSRNGMIHTKYSKKTM